MIQRSYPVCAFQPRLFQVPDDVGDLPGVAVSGRGERRPVAYPDKIRFQDTTRAALHACRLSLK